MGELVVIFGAGATRGAFEDKLLPPPPLDSDFFEIAGQLKGRGTGKLASRVINDVFQLYRRVNGVGLEQYFQDIETRAEIGSFAKPQNQPKDWAKRKKNLEELIRRVLLHTTCDLMRGSAKPHTSAAHTTILRQLKGKDTVITFNYDTVIEESIPREGQLWSPRDGYGLAAGGVRKDWAKKWGERHNVNPVSNSTISLLKLHGSLNWAQNNAIRLKPRPYVVRSRGSAAVFDKCSILPPGWHKRISINPYKHLWRKARLSLERCTALAIIGYSLPETDMLARGLFAEVSRLRAAREDYLRHLHLADPDDTVRSKFVEMFIPALGPKGRVYRYEDINELSKVWNQTPPQR